MFKFNHFITSIEDKKGSRIELHELFDECALKRAPLLVQNSTSLPPSIQ